jgi:hypothetical protein
MKKSTQLPATWLVGRKVRLRPLETQDVPRLRRFGLAVDAKATPFIVQTHAGDDVGALGFLIDGPQAAISVAFADRRSLIDGYAADALRVMCSGAFRSLPLVRIEALVPAEDDACLSAYRRAGFKREGVLRGATRVRGRYQDATVLSMLRDDQD